MTNLQKKSINYWFTQFHLGNVELDQLIESLQDWEDKFKSKDKNASLWFKFYREDTLATTIDDLNRNLNPSTSTNVNRKFMQERIRIAVDENSLQIYFQ